MMVGTGLSVDVFTLHWILMLHELLFPRVIFQTQVFYCSISVNLIAARMLTNLPYRSIVFLHMVPLFVASDGCLSITHSATEDNTERNTARTDTRKPLHLHSFLQNQQLRALNPLIPRCYGEMELSIHTSHVSAHLHSTVWGLSGS